MHKIKVVTLQHCQRPYYRYAHAINEKYCTQHGHSFTVFRPEMYPSDRFGHWLKIDAVLSQLFDTDFVLYLDSDAYFFDHARTVPSLLNVHLKREHEILVGTDRQNAAFAWSDQDANTGVFITRNTEKARRILTDWHAMPANGSRWAFEWPVEQGGFNAHILPKYRSAISIVQYFYLNGTDGRFIRHLVGENDRYRHAVLRSEHARLVGRSKEHRRIGARRFDDAFSDL